MYKYIIDYGCRNEVQIPCGSVLLTSYKSIYSRHQVTLRTGVQTEGKRLETHLYGDQCKIEGRGGGGGGEMRVGDQGEIRRTRLLLSRMYPLIEPELSIGYSIQ